MVGTHRLHSKVAIVTAGNKDTDNAIVHAMSTALQSRMAHLELLVDAGEWCEWAYANGIDHRITSYIKFKPGNLHNFTPDHSDKTYPCPRTWAFGSGVLNQKPDKEDLLPLMAGVISEGTAREFIGFTKIYDSLPKAEDIIRAAETVPVPREPSILYALTGSIAHHITQDNAKPLMTYVKRLPVEFQVVSLREIVRRDKKMLTAKPVQDWIATSAVELF